MTISICFHLTLFILYLVTLVLVFPGDAMVKSACQCRRHRRLLGWDDPLACVCVCVKVMVGFIVMMVMRGFPGGSDGKESACNAGDLASIPGSDRSPGDGKDNSLQ